MASYSYGISGLRKSRRSRCALLTTAVATTLCTLMMSERENTVFLAPGSDRDAMLRRSLLCSAVVLPWWSQAASAVSGGGLDYSGAKLTTPFKGGKYDGKDFSGASAVGQDMSEAFFRGCRFYKADMSNSDFSKSDLSGAGMEGCNLDGVNFQGANLEGAYFSQTILDAKNLKGALFTDALFSNKKIVTSLCDREDVKADAKTADSIPCP